MGLLHVAAIGCALGLAGFAYFAIHGPLIAWRSTIDQQVTITRASLAEGAELRRRHAELRRQRQQLLKRVEDVNRRVPDEPREAEFLADLNRLATEHGVVIEDFQRGATTEKPTHSMVAISITARASHAALCGLCNSISALPRIAELTRLDIDPDPSRDGYPVEMSYALYYGIATSAGGASP